MQESQACKTSGGTPAALLSITGLVRSHRGLRPLRIQRLSVMPGAIVSLAGLDEAAAEVFVSLVTGAGLPDEGCIDLFGQPTSDIPDTAGWLASLDRLGLVSGRAVLIEPFSARQNIAMPFTLAVDPIAAAVLPAVDALAREVGLTPEVWDDPVGPAGPDVQARVRLARALALDPALVLAEHPTAELSREAAAAFGTDLARVAARRGLAVVAVTGDPQFAKALGGEALTLKPATGELTRATLWGRLFGG